MKEKTVVRFPGWDLEKRKTKVLHMCARFAHVCFCVSMATWGGDGQTANTEKAVHGKAWKWIGCQPGLHTVEQSMKLSLGDRWAKQYFSAEGTVMDFFLGFRLCHSVTDSFDLWGRQTQPWQNFQNVCVKELIMQQCWLIPDKEDFIQHPHARYGDHGNWIIQRRRDFWPQVGFPNQRVGTEANWLESY